MREVPLYRPGLNKELSRMLGTALDAKIQLKTVNPARLFVHGSYVRLSDFMYHSTLGLRVIKRKGEEHHARDPETQPHTLNHQL
jgi:hypothetical protein